MLFASRISCLWKNEPCFLKRAFTTLNARMSNKFDVFNASAACKTEALSLSRPSSSSSPPPPPLAVSSNPHAYRRELASTTRSLAFDSRQFSVWPADLRVRRSLVQRALRWTWRASSHRRPLVSVDLPRLALKCAVRRVVKVDLGRLGLVEERASSEHLAADNKTARESSQPTGAAPTAAVAASSAGC